MATLHHFSTVTGKRLACEQVEKKAQRKADYELRLLAAAHIRKLATMDVLPRVNVGWCVTEDSYLSKTGKGILQTTRLGPRKYEHKILPR